jgi:hypothetical protein
MQSAMWRLKSPAASVCSASRRFGGVVEAVLSGVGRQGTRVELCFRGGAVVAAAVAE